MSMLRRFTIKQRLLINGLALISAMLLMLGILFYQSAQLDKLARMQQLVEQLNIDVLTFRRHEKDFVMRSELRYQQQLNSHFQLMQNHAAELQLLLTEYQIDTAPLQRFGELTTLYRQSFNELVTQQQLIGLDEQSGLMGALRQAARQLEQQFTAMQQADHLVAILQLRRDEKDFLLRREQRYAAEFNSGYQAIYSQLQQTESAAARLLFDYHRSFNQLAEAISVMGLDETQGLTGRMRSAIQQTESSLQVLSEAANHSIDEARAFAQQLAIGLFILVLIVVLLLVAFTSRSIIEPIMSVCRTIGMIRTESDFRLRVAVDGQDEMTTLATDFNFMLTDCQQLINSVNQALDMLDTATGELAASTADTSKGMRQQQLESDMVATAVTEMGATINEIAANTESTASKAELANQNALNGRQEVQQTVSRIQQLSDRLQNAAKIVQALEADTKTISSVMDVIRGIADQTNLLALNAAIEAARAGEQGRGFAVVADEVRSLAMRTQESTRQIEGTVKGLQERTTDIVAVILSCREEGADSAGQANVAMQLLSNITADVTNIMDMTTQIAAAIEEQSHVAAEVNKNMVRIRDLSEESYGYAQHNASISEEVANQAASLRRTVEHFKT